jgi:hypothetical protein
MISQTDIFSEIASFLPFADNFVCTFADAYRTELPQLQRMGVTTTTMQMNPTCVAARPSLLTTYHKGQDVKTVVEGIECPSIIFDYIILQDKSVDNFTAIIAGLYANKNWVTRPKAVEFLYSPEAGKYEDDEEMMDLCKYDCVLQTYVEDYRSYCLDSIKDYIHGRTPKRMFQLINASYLDVTSLASTIETIEELEEFVGYIISEGHGHIIGCIVDLCRLGRRYSERLRDVYTRSLE